MNNRGAKFSRQEQWTKQCYVCLVNKEYEQLWFGIELRNLNYFTSWEKTIQQLQYHCGLPLAPVYCNQNCTDLHIVFNKKIALLRSVGPIGIEEENDRSHFNAWLSCVQNQSKERYEESFLVQGIAKINVLTTRTPNSVQFVAVWCLYIGNFFCFCVQFWINSLIILLIIGQIF